ncbi:MAG: sigma-70 family RNA polymerase sigma factor [Gemmatimonadota bacterium]
MSAYAFDAAFRAAFASRYAELFRVVHRYLGDASLAGDIAQETFVRLYNRGTMPDDLRAWLVSVALNQARDEQRTQSRRLRLLRRRAPEEHMGDAARAPDEDVLSAERRSLVRRALVLLPERDRALLLLREEGYSYRELALSLDIVESSVGTLLARAKVAFRKVYESQQRENIKPVERA